MKQKLAQKEARSEKRSRRKYVFINRFYAPDHSATSQILSEVSRSLASQGLNVIVITSRWSYDGESKFKSHEQLRGVLVVRVWTTKFGRNVMLGRAIDYLTFYISSMLSLLKRCSRHDVIIAKTDPPMLSVPAELLARLKGAKLINWLQDIFPEAAVELGVTSADSLWTKILLRLRNESFRRATMNVVIGVKMQQKLAALKVRPDRIEEINNFVDDRKIVRTPEYGPGLREQWRINEDTFVVGYSGNFGRAHDLHTILDTATALNEVPGILFLFIGNGHQHFALKREIKKRELKNIMLKPYQPTDSLPQSLSLPNLHLATLNPKLEGLIVPSKVYGIAAAGRPMLMIGSHDGEIGTIISANDMGICVAPGAPEKAKRAILDLKGDPIRAETMGRNARAWLDNHASRSAVLKKWFSLSEKI